MKLISIIIPFYNRWQLTHKSLMQLHQFAPENTEIVVVNDASTEIDCETGMHWWQTQGARHKLRYRKNEKNLGFGGSMNVGAKTARGDIFIFLSNDVSIYGDFVSEIQDRLIEKPNSLLGGRIIDWDSGWNTVQYKGNKMIVPYCEGWLLACTREIWEHLGGFDDQYAPYDYEDVCLSTMAQYIGIGLIALNSPKVEHIGAQTAKYGSERERITKRNRVLWEAKWADKWEEFWSDENEI